MDSAGFALTRAEWQRVLFNAPNRADLAGCVPAWNLHQIAVRVHRNHGFEAVSTATVAYAAWNGLDFNWAIGAYDDTLSFELHGGGSAEVVWLDTGRMCGRAEERIGAWLVARLRALRSQTTNPIVVLAWPLSPSDRDLVEGAEIPGIYVADLGPFAASLGNRWIDLRAESISGTRLSNQACLRLARELACCWLPAVTRPPRKAIAVDLDGTLYRGVLGEDGPSGVELTRGHHALQARLVRFREAGILLALISRNELVDVEHLFRERSDFPLRLSDFSAVEVSWNDKASALHRTAAALHIGAEAIVFVDDNPGELAAVASTLPVFTVHASPDGVETKAALEHVAGIFRWHSGSEDALRAVDLLASKERSAIEVNAASPEEYLRSLHVQLEFFVGPRQHLARMAELTAKTNQFNLALRRMNETEIARRLDDCPCNVVAIRLADRLSDSGIVGLLVGIRVEDILHIDELCVSCRALGRRLEDSMLTKALLIMVEDRPPAKVMFALRKGPRNEPARQWLARYTNTALNDDIDTVAMPFDAISAKTVSSAVRVEVIR